MWKAEVFKLGEALGLWPTKWTTQKALEAIEAPKSTIAAVRAAVEWATLSPSTSHPSVQLLSRACAAPFEMRHEQSKQARAAAERPWR